MVDQLPFQLYNSYFTPGVKRIYLAGCDLGNSAAHFHNSTSSGVRNDGGSSFYLSAWKKLPEFLKKNYPDVQIISINPVGLNGIFWKTYMYEKIDRRFVLPRAFSSWESK